MEENKLKKVVVTGFGPFFDQTVNTSWEAVKLLSELKIEGVELIVEEILEKIKYKQIDDRVEMLWETHKPMLVMYVGVKDITGCLEIETTGMRTDFICQDCEGETEETEESTASGDDAINCCKIDVKKICENINNDKTNIKINVSLDAGRFLCQLVYRGYKNMKRTLFVHAPVLDSPYSTQELAIGLKNIIKEALKQLEQCESTNSVPIDYITIEGSRFKKVVVTGFGPFFDQTINASWEAVKLLPELKIEGIEELIVEEIPVTYKDVDERVQILWKTHKPMLVMHVGVKDITGYLEIETTGNRTGYCHEDCKGFMHKTGECTASGDDTINCEIDVMKICENINDKTNIKINVSLDAGRYLCGYIFYKSLNIDRKRTLFVHVPLLDSPYSARELAIGLKSIINEALKQLEECECTNNL